MANLDGLVSLCARIHCRKCHDIEYDDFLNVGFEGLDYATKTFDTDRGVKFTTYAYHVIIGRMKHLIRECAGVIHIPSWVIESKNYSNIPEVVSEENIFNGKVIHHYDSAVSGIDDIELFENKMLIEFLMTNLKPRQKKILMMYYFDMVTQREIADIIGISANAVSVSIRNSIRKMRRCYEQSCLS